MRCRTWICISLLHKLILYHLEDQNFVQFSKHADYYRVLVVFETISTCQIFCFCTLFFITILKTNESVILCDEGIN